MTVAGFPAWLLLLAILLPNAPAKTLGEVMFRKLEGVACAQRENYLDQDDGMLD